MWRFALRQAGHLALGLLGAVLLAASVAAIPARSGQYLSVLLERLAAMANGDFGISAIGGGPATAELAARLPATLELLMVGAVLSLLIGVPLGLALGSGRILRAAAPLFQIVAATPVFCAGLALVWFAVEVLGWTDLRYGGKDLWSALFEGDGQAASLALRAFALPALTVGVAGAACVQLALRRAASEAADQPYRSGLRLMGLSAFDIERLYVAPLMAAQILASLGEIALALLSAAAVAEWVFVWPGAAVLFVKAVALHDWNVAALVLLVFASITLVAQFLGRLGARAIVVEDQRP